MTSLSLRGPVWNKMILNPQLDPDKAGCSEESCGFMMDPNKSMIISCGGCVNALRANLKMDPKPA